MPKLTIKENYMRMVNGEMPEYLSVFDLFWGFNMPPFMMGERNPDFTGKDIFGVDQVMDSGGITPAAMPKTHDFILTDITKWRDVISLPESPWDDTQWEDWAKQVEDIRDPNQPWGGGCGLGLFQSLVGIMGFSEGLMACYEEPEEVKAMLDYITNWMIKQNKKFLQFCKPDFGFYADDIAHERAPFLATDMFQELIAPGWKAFYDTFVENDIPVGHHNCGYFVPYLDILLDMGVKFWDPVQLSNDPLALQKEYGSRVILNVFPEARKWEELQPPEEFVRGEFRAFWDELAPGGFVACNNYLITTGMPGRNAYDEQMSVWLGDEFEKIRYSYYN